MKKYMVVLVVVLLQMVVVVGIASAQCRNEYNRRQAERLGKEIGMIIVDSVFGNTGHHGYQYRQYNEYDRARAEGYRQAQERYWEDQRRQAERAHRRIIEDARRQGERDFYQRRGW